MDTSLALAGASCHEDDGNLCSSEAQTLSPVDKFQIDLVSNWTWAHVVKDPSLRQEQTGHRIVKSQP